VSQIDCQLNHKTHCFGLFFTVLCAKLSADK